MSKLKNILGISFTYFYYQIYLTIILIFFFKLLTLCCECVNKACEGDLDTKWEKV